MLCSQRYASETGVSAVGIDWQQDLKFCASVLKIPFQGNLDPLRLFGAPEKIEDIVSKIKTAVAGKPYIFNLGHGISKDTPIETVAHLLRTLRQS